MDIEKIVEIVKQIPVSDETAITFSAFYNSDREINLVGVYLHHKEKALINAEKSEICNCEGISVHVSHIYPEVKEEETTNEDQ